MGQFWSIATIVGPLLLLGVVLMALLRDRMRAVRDANARTKQHDLRRD